MADLPPVEGTFLDYGYSEVIGKSIENAGADTAAGGGAADEQGVQLEAVYNAAERRAEENAGAWLTDNDIFFTGGNLADNLIILGCPVNLACTRALIRAPEQFRFLGG